METVNEAMPLRSFVTRANYAGYSYSKHLDDHRFHKGGGPSNAPQAIYAIFRALHKQYRSQTFSLPLGIGHEFHLVFLTLAVLCNLLNELCSIHLPRASYPGVIVRNARELFACISPPNLSSYTAPTEQVGFLHFR